MKKIFIVLMITLGIIIDQISKYYFFNLKYMSSSYFFEPVLNQGISFSLPISYLIVIPLTLVALWIFVYLLTRKEINVMMFVLLCAGTIGNLIDRVVYDGVRDFIVMFDWFVYNLSDLYLSLAICMIIIGIIKGNKKPLHHS